MIFTDRTIIVQKGISSINDTIVLYRGDRDIEVRFTINEGSPFKFGNGKNSNIIEKTEATYGQLVIKTPNDLPPIFSKVAPTNEGRIVFTITGGMIDEITEVGNYTFQIRLLDENMDSRVTLPEVKDGIEIREPIALEDISTTNEVEVAAVGYALITGGTQEDIFDAEGNYNKRTWTTGDRITAPKLNKIEGGIDGVNQKTINNSNKIEAIGSTLKNQINVLKDDVDKHNVIVDKLKNDNKLNVDIQKVVNLLNPIDSYSYSNSSFSLTIDNSIITVNGFVDDYYYLKLTNGLDIGNGPSGSSKKPTWQQETYTELTKGKDYALKCFVLQGTAVDTANVDMVNTIVVSARDNTYTSVLTSKQSKMTLQGDICYIQLYLPPGTYTDVQIGLTLQEDIVPTTYNPDSYYISSVTTHIADYPTVINGTLKKEISGTNFNAIQGGCTDGEFIYCGIVHDHNDAGNTTLHKLNIKTNEIVKTVTDFSLGHCNSMTYCDHDGFIHCIALDDSSTVHRITTDLEYVDSYTLNIANKYPAFTSFREIDYNKEKECFILSLAEKNGYAIYTKNRTFIRVISCITISNHVYGGLTTDKNFIYQTVCGPNLEPIVGIFDWNGNFITQIQVSNVTGEIEECMILGNKFYATGNQGGYTNHNIWELTPSSYVLYRY